MKIFTKTFLYTLAMLVLLALLANYLIYTLMPNFYTKQKQQELTALADQMVVQLESANREDIVNIIGSSAIYGQSNITVYIGDDKYSIMTWSGSSLFGGTTNAFVAISTASVSDTDSKGQTSNVAIIPADDVLHSIGSQVIEAQRSFTMAGEAGTVDISMTLAPVDEAVDVIFSLLPVSILLCVIIAIVFSLLYARAITRPIKAISNETRHMTALERDAKCHIKSRDEIGDLAANVNYLYENLLNTIDSLEAELKKVTASEKAKNDFLRAASHELKTPVTAVSVIMDNMILGVGKYKNHDEWLVKCKELVDSLSEKLREILDASRLETQSEAYATQSLEALCSEILDPYIILAKARGLDLFVDLSASFPVTAPPKLLGKALSNIFSNAVLYTGQGGKVSIYCKGRSLMVENECEPIPEDQLSRLYEPFYRPDISRSRETGGNGLGLYIVETILRRLQLDYRFEAMTSPVGMRFTINF